MDALGRSLPSAVEPLDMGANEKGLMQPAKGQRNITWAMVSNCPQRLQAPSTRKPLLRSDSPTAIALLDNFQRKLFSFGEQLTFHTQRCQLKSLDLPSTLSFAVAYPDLVV